MLKNELIKAFVNCYVESFSPGIHNCKMVNFVYIVNGVYLNFLNIKK